MFTISDYVRKYHQHPRITLVPLPTYTSTPQCTTTSTSVITNDITKKKKPFLQLNKNEIGQYIPFCVCHLSLNITFVRFFMSLSTEVVHF